MNADLKRILLAFTLVNSLVLALVMTFVASDRAQSASTAVKVCVNSKSKAVYFKTTCSSGEVSKVLGYGAATTVVGPSTTEGKSAYDIWLELGNTGSKADFIRSLKGTDAAASPLDQLWKLAGCKGKMQITELLVDLTYQWSSSSDGNDSQLLPLTLDAIDRSALAIAGCPTIWMQEGLGFVNGGAVTVPRQ